MIPLATALTFVWLGMVLAISFMEAPLKFRAPEVTLRIGLGIGRLVFRALNIAEVVLAALLSAALLLSDLTVGLAIAPVGAILILMVQMAGIRPRLSARSDAVLAGADAPRSQAHYVYIAAEALKVVALLVAGVGFLGY